MKKYFFFFILILNLNSFSQWNFHYVMGQRLTTIFTLDSIQCWIGGDFGVIHKTVNGGVNWIEYSTGTGNSVNGLHFFSSENGIAISGDKILKTSDGGEIWNVSFSVLGQFTSLFFINNQLGFVSSYNPSLGSSIYTTSNGGNDWELLKLSDTVKFNSIFFINQTTGFICGGIPAVIYKTTDAGSSWIKTILEEGIKSFENITFANENNGYAVGTNGIFYKTTNSGVTWDKINFYTFKFVSVEAKENHVWATVSDITADYIIHSVDFGNTWYKQYTAFETINDIKIINNTGWAVGTFGLILKTTNRGVVNIPSPQTPALIIPIENAFNVQPKVTFGWVNASFVIFRLQVSEVNNFSSPLYDLLVIERFCEIELELNKRYYWRVRAENPSGVSLWSPVRTFTTDDPTSIDEDYNTNKNFVLFQNYPNPFNPTTVVIYQLNVESKVSLIIYDILGNKIKTLVNEVQNSGIYNLNIDSNDLGGVSGVYYYRLKINENRNNIYTDTKKMMLLK